jgi:lipoate-protein ligase A
MSNADRKTFSLSFANNIAGLLKIEIKTSNFDADDIEYSRKIAEEKYSNPQWNNKF